MKINGKELELELYDVETFEKVEKSYAEFMKVIFGEFETQSEAIRANCTAFVSLLDDVFGTGTAIKVLGNRLNYIVVCDAHQEFIEELIVQRQKLDELTKRQIESINKLR